MALYSLAGPVVFSIVWFCVWGGIALRQARQALELESLGVTLFNNSAHFMTDSNEFCYDVPQEDILVDGEVLFTNHLPGVTPVCKFDEDNPDSAIFHVLDSFSFEKSFGRRGLGPVLCLVFMIACAVFFITSAGAISLIVDKMASSGRKNDHLARRVFWLVTAAALSSALLSTGGEDALGGVQATMMICGVPCAILLCYVMQSVTLMCRQATNQAIHEYQVPDQAEFSMPVYGGILNTFEYVASFGQVSQARLDQGIGSASAVQTTEFIRGLVIPFVTLSRVLAELYPLHPRTNLVFAGCYGLCYVSWVCLCVASLRWAGLAGLASTVFVVQGSLLAMVRSGFRARYNIRSNMFADVIASTLLWPQVLSQLSLSCGTQLVIDETSLGKTQVALCTRGA